MQEPRPTITPPPTSEPTLRVGLVLEEDVLSKIKLHIACQGANITAGVKTLSLKSDLHYLLEVVSEEILMRDSAGALVGSFQTPLTIRPQSNQCLPQKGLGLSPLIAGRQFHWKKEISAAFPGELEVHIVRGNLVIVNLVSFEDYIACVMSSEMSSACPTAFMRAQGIAARSWAVCFLGSKHPGKLYTICNDDDCQRYQGTTHASAESIFEVNACRGEFLVDRSGHTCAAYYSKSCGGHSEKPELAFGFSSPGVSEVCDRGAADEPALNKRDTKQLQECHE